MTLLRRGSPVTSCLLSPAQLNLQRAVNRSAFRGCMLPIPLQATNAYCAFNVLEASVLGLCSSQVPSCCLGILGPRRIQRKRGNLVL